MEILSPFTHRHYRFMAPRTNRTLMVYGTAPGFGDKVVDQNTPSVTSYA